MRNAPDPEIVQIAIQEKKAGASLGDIATAVGVSRTTVQRWLDKYGDGDPALRPRTGVPPALASVVARRKAAEEAKVEADAPTVSAANALPENATALERNRAMQRDLIRIADEAFAVGNYGAAQRANRDATQLSLVIARLEKEQGADGDTLHISRADIEAAKLAYRERVRALLTRPILCAHCNRELTIAWVNNELKAKPVPAGDDEPTT